MEFAHLLVNGAKSATRGSRASSTDERVVVVPIINVDGFVESREGGALGIPDPGRHDRARPRCRPSRAWRCWAARSPTGARTATARSPSGERALHAAVRHRPEPKLRQRLGRPGRRHRPDHAELPRHRARSPSPRPRAVWEFSRERQVTTLITLHNVAALVLRPPGLQDAGKAPDEVALKALGDAMADAAGYQSQYSLRALRHVRHDRRLHLRRAGRLRLHDRDRAAGRPVPHALPDRRRATSGPARAATGPRARACARRCCSAPRTALDRSSTTRSSPARRSPATSCGSARTSRPRPASAAPTRRATSTRPGSAARRSTASAGSTSSSSTTSSRAR